MTYTKEQLMEKIKKLLALATDTSTTEHERSLAMKHAQDLMAEYSIEECDLNSTAPDLIVKERYIFNAESLIPPILHDGPFFHMLITPICQNFGCYTFRLQGLNQHYIMGFKANVEIAKYACDVLLNQGIKDYKPGFTKARTIGYSITFWNGFRDGLRERFAKLSNEKAIVLYDKVKAEWEKNIKRFFINVPTSTDLTGGNAGRNSAKNAILNQGIKTFEGRQIK